MTTLIKDGVPRLIIVDAEGILAASTSNYVNLVSISLPIGFDITDLQNFVRAGIFDLKVTSIKIRGELILPKSKGIGSVGEIIHVVGSKNEEVILEIKENRFPGVLSATLKILLSKLLNRGSIVVLVDDSLNVVTAIIKNYNIHKDGDEEGIITGSISLEVFPILDQQSGISTSLISIAATTLVANIDNYIPNWRAITKTQFTFIGDFIKEKVITNGR